MLVLTRKETEQIVIGDDIVITVNRINGNRVAIGIEAPREVSIVRGELENRTETPKVVKSPKSVEGSPNGSNDVAVAS